MNHIPWWKTRLGAEEVKSPMAAIQAGRLSQGEITAELEAKLAEQLKVPYVTLTTSGSVALLLTLIASGIGPGDEVIVSNRTFIATAHAPQLIGARIRLVDTKEDVPLMDPEQVLQNITPNTKAIIPVHLNGRACNLSLLREIADQHGLCLIEDAAQALFSKYKGNYLGGFGHFGCFSLGVTKLITSGQGGFVVTNNKTFHEKLQLLRSHGVDSPLSEQFGAFGFNFRYTDIQASIALKQLERAPHKIKAHLKLYKQYGECIKDFRSVRMLKVETNKGEVPIWIEVLCKERDRLMSFLTKRGIESRKATPNLNVSPHLRDRRIFRNSDYFEKRLLVLPSGPDQEPKDIERTLKALTDYEHEYNHQMLT